MKKFLFALIVIFLSTPIIISATDDDDSDGHPNDWKKGESAKNLVNPPNPKIVWQFWGGQTVNATFTNGNALGVTIEILCAQYYEYPTTKKILAPFTSYRRAYSCFDYHPLHWNFNVATFSDAAMIRCRAEWNKTVPDRPGFPRDTLI